MTSQEFFARYRDPRWQKKRLELLERAGWKCEICGASEKELHAHHVIYRKDTAPWEYEDYEYRVLCDKHHLEIEEQVKPAVLAMGTWMDPLVTMELVDRLCHAFNIARSNGVDFKPSAARTPSEIVTDLFDTDCWFKQLEKEHQEAMWLEGKQ